MRWSWPEIFAIQDAIAELLRTESLPTGPRHSGNVSLGLVRQGHSALSSGWPRNALLRQACELDYHTSGPGVDQGRDSDPEAKVACDPNANPFADVMRLPPVAGPAG
jgi:hypothetical protein